MKIKEFFRPSPFKIVFTLVVFGPLVYLLMREIWSIYPYTVSLSLLICLFVIYVFACLFAYVLFAQRGFQQSKKKVFFLIVLLVILLILPIFPGLGALLSIVVYLLFLYLFLSLTEGWFLDLTKWILSLGLYIGYSYLWMLFYAQNIVSETFGLLELGSWIVIGILSFIETFVFLIVHLKRKKNGEIQSSGN